LFGKGLSLQLLQGKSNIPTDADEMTELLIWEIQHLWELLHDSHRPTDVTPDIYNYYWRGAKESTSSALLAVHFGQWKALIQSPHLVKFVCKQLNLIARCGILPSRWSNGNGLQVLLEKVPGVSLVDKLRAILLMEGNFNFFNKWIFGHEAVNRLYDIDYIPQDQFSQKKITAKDSKLDNKLTMDLSRQLRILTALVLADADKCYDKINHILMSLLLRAITGVPEAISAMLTPIQCMKFYQRTGRGDSNTFMGGQSKDSPLQGLCEGNGCAPMCWLMLSLLLMKCYHKEGHGLAVTSPISGKLIKFMGEIYVNDMDLFTLLLDVPDLETLMEITQGNLNKWARLLNATGGALNPDKCYWYLIYYKCRNGVWEYGYTENYSFTIPLPNNTRAKISQLHITEAKKMLGVWSNPIGSDEKHLKEVVVGKMKQWASRIKIAHLSVHLVWKAYR
jgi:hypothetical protein